MVILLTTVFIVFDTGCKVFTMSCARLEIMEMARTVLHIMERDIGGAMVDADGRVFRGYGFAYHPHLYTTYSGAYGRRGVFAMPGLTDGWRTTSFYMWASRDRKHSNNYSDLLWFRTNTAPEARGGQAEVIYRLAFAPGG